jgi:hypothetical protein
MSYRDDQASLEARRDDLQRELSELTEKAEALEAVTRDKEAVERELAAVEARLAHHAARRLPILEGVRIAAPCSARWEDMAGDERVRFCESCEQKVYNLSAMPRDEAERLLAEHGASICVRLYKRADGTVMTSDCPVGVKRRRRRRAIVAVVGAGAMAATAAAAFAATWTQGKPPIAEPTPMMGAVAPVMGTAEPVVPAPPPPPRADPPGTRARPHLMGKPVAPPSPEK